MFRITKLIVLCLLWSVLAIGCQTARDSSPSTPSVRQANGYRITLIDDATTKETSYNIPRRDLLSEDVLGQAIKFRADGKVINYHGSYRKELIR